MKEVEHGVGDRKGEFFDRFARLFGELAQFRANPSRVLGLTLLGSLGAGTLNFDSDFGFSKGMSRGTGGGVLSESS